MTDRWWENRDSWPKARDLFTGMGDTFVRTLSAEEAFAQKACETMHFQAEDLAKLNAEVRTLREQVRTLQRVVDMRNRELRGSVGL